MGFEFCPPVAHLLIIYACVPTGHVITPRPITTPRLTTIQPTDGRAESSSDSTSLMMNIFWTFFKLSLLLKYIDANRKALAVCLVCSTLVGTVCLVLLLIIVDYTGKNFGCDSKAKRKRYAKRNPELHYHVEDGCQAVQPSNGPLYGQPTGECDEPETCLLNIVPTTSRQTTLDEDSPATGANAEQYDNVQTTPLLPRRRMSEQEEHELDDLIDAMRKFSDAVDPDRILARRPPENSTWTRGIYPNRPQSCSPSLNSFRNHSDSNIDEGRPLARHTPTPRSDGASSSCDADDVRVYPVPLPHKTSLRALSTKSNNGRIIHSVTLPHRPTRTRSESGAYNAR